MMVQGTAMITNPWLGTSKNTTTALSTSVSLSTYKPILIQTNENSNINNMMNKTRERWQLGGGSGGVNASSIGWTSVEPMIIVPIDLISFIWFCCSITICVCVFNSLLPMHSSIIQYIPLALHWGVFPTFWYNSGVKLQNSPLENIVPLRLHTPYCILGILKLFQFWLKGWFCKTTWAVFSGRYHYQNAQSSFHYWPSVSPWNCHSL